MKRKLFILALLMCVIAGCLTLTACGSSTKKSKSSNNNGTYYYYDIESDEYYKTAKFVIDGKTFTMYDGNENSAQGNFTVSGKSFIATAKVTQSGKTMDVKFEGTVSDGVINITKETVTENGKSETITCNVYFCKEGKKPAGSTGQNKPKAELKFSLNEDGRSYSVSGIEIFTISNTDINIVIPYTYNGLPVTSIGDDAFCYCYPITSITIPDSITSIGDYAFEGCTGLNSITIPDTVTSIYTEAFKDCAGLKSITYTGTKAQWNAIDKDSDWNTNTGNYTVHCTDGDIAK